MIFFLFFVVVVIFVAFFPPKLQNQTEYLNTELVKSMYLVAKKGKIVLGFPLCMICICNRTTYCVIISELDKHAVLLTVYYMASVMLSYPGMKSAKNVAKLVFGNLLKLCVSTPQVKHRLILVFLLL